MSRYSPTFTPSIHQCASPFAWSPVFTTSTTSQRCHSPRARKTAARFGVRLRAGTGVICRRSCASTGPLPLPCSEKYTTGSSCSHTNAISLKLSKVRRDTTRDRRRVRLVRTPTLLGVQLHRTPDLHLLEQGTRIRRMSTHGGGLRSPDGTARYRRGARLHALSRRRAPVD